MNIFVTIGKVLEIAEDGKVIKFVLSVKQEKPCNLPCVLFTPTSEVKAMLENAKRTEGLIVVKGRVMSDEFEFNGRLIRKVEIATYPQSVSAL